MTRRIAVWLGVLGVMAMSLAAAQEIRVRSRQMSPPAHSDFLPPPLDTRVIGQTRWLTDSQAAFKVVTFDRRSQRPVRAQVEVTLRSPAGESKVYRQATRYNGTAEVALRTPSEPGDYTLAIQVDSPIGQDEVERTITVEEVGQILLTTDKPLYQPSQTVHLRALCLRKPDLQALGDLPLTFEAQDPKGNRVFRVSVPTSRFGIAACEFPIADQVTLGEYRITATLQDRWGEEERTAAPDARSLATTERTIRVERYVLPKFKVEVETEKRYYQPAQRLRGTVKAAYFFGKPVEGQVEVRLSTFAAGWQDIAELNGTLSTQGVWSFETQLPERFVGLPLEGGNALLRVEAAVTDQAAHTERGTSALPVSNDPIQIALVPESAQLMPNLPVRLFVVTTYPDGTPAPCRFTVSSRADQGQAFQVRGETDAAGIGEATVTLDRIPSPTPPPTAGRVRPGFAAMPGQIEEGGADQPASPAGVPLTVTVTATDRQGQQATAERPLSLAATDDAVLLRTDRVLARVGESLRLELLTAARPGPSYNPVFLDAVLNGQTVLTKTVEIRGGKGEMSLPLTADLAGTLLLHAYRITPGGDTVRDTRVVLVEAANDLQVEMEADRDTHRPGETARLRFAVSDRSGRPTVAALGLTVVDESLFALAESQPGLERLYFELERELLQPRYEVHGWELQPVLLNPEGASPIAGGRERAARVLLAAAAPELSHSLNVSTYDQKAAQLQERWQQFVNQAAERIRKALERYQHQRGRYPAPEEALQELVDAKLLSEQDIRDPLGRRYRLQPYGDDLRYGFALISAGMDGEFETKDDVVGGPPEFFNDRARRFGGVRLEEQEAVFAMPMAAAPGMAGGAAMDVLKAKQGTGAGTAVPGHPPAPEVRVRQYFPETMFVEPELITDERGRASLEIPMADSITTWRLTTLASSAQGQLGSSSFPLRVFQDFFVDLDLPVSFTQGDEVSVPVAVYNYLARPQKVSLRVDTGEGFQALEESRKELALQPNEVTSVRFRLKAAHFGSHPITVHADGEAMSDAIKRTVEVLPDGKETWATVSDQLTGKGPESGSVTRTVTIAIPPQAIAGAHTLLVKLYPGAFTQVLEGLDSLLRMPFGCFEQTSSVTYPNVLVLGYLKRTKQAQPEMEMKARHYITIGYQRLLTYEVSGGGFSWFGDPPAHQVLTAYGLLEFADMSRVHEVDPQIIARTAQWLAGRQQQNGSWTPDQGGIREGAIDRQNDVLRATAYIAWALAEAGDSLKQAGAVSEPVRRAIGYLTERGAQANDGYALAVMLNALLGARPVGVSADVGAIDRTARRLAGLAKEQDDAAYWESERPTPLCGKGESGDLETTALAAYALIQHGGYGPLVNKALTYLVRHKDAFGTWQTTQATIWSLKAFIAAMERGTGAAEGTVIVKVNGEQAAQWELTPATADLLRQVDASRFAKEGGNQVSFEFDGKGGLLYQVSARSYLPWDRVPRPLEEPLQIKVDYDRTQLQTNETVTCRVRVTNRQPVAAQMVLVDVGIPPGFEVRTDDLVAQVERKTLKRYELTPRQVICYLDRIEANTTVEWSFQLRAKMPVRAKSGRTIAYEYYAPDKPATFAPVTLTAGAESR